MLHGSHSVQNLQAVALPPPRSSSNINLAASAGPPGMNSSSSSGSHNYNGSNAAAAQGSHASTYTSPSFLRSVTAGTGQTSPSPHHGFVRSTSEMPPSPSLRMHAPSSTHSHSYHHPQTQKSGSGSHTPTQPTFSHNPPSLHHSASVSHFGQYDSRLVANTINKIESSSTAGSLVNATSGANSSTSAVPPGSSHGPENDAWTAACIRTLPLFNGEGQRGYIEDLNDLVSIHIKRTTDCLGKTTNAINALSSDLIDLLAMGMLTLNAKLVDLNDDRLLVRITEVWNFFFIGCLPYIEGIFLPLRTDNTLRSIVGHLGNGARSIAFSAGATRDTVEVIDIRRIALRAFRDHLVLPIVDRLAILFSSDPSGSAAHPAEPSSRPGTTVNVSSTTRTASARRLQMVSILISVQTNDERQTAAEALGQALRVGMEKQSSTYAADTAPVSFANGLYGAAMYSYAARAASESGREVEKKAWKKGRHTGPPSSRDGSVHTKHRTHSIDPGADGRSDHGSRASERSRRPTLDGDDERRYSDHGRRNDHEKIPMPSTSRDVPEIAIVD